MYLSTQPFLGPRPPVQRPGQQYFPSRFITTMARSRGYGDIIRRIIILRSTRISYCNNKTSGSQGTIKNTQTHCADNLNMFSLLFIEKKKSTCPINILNVDYCSSRVPIKSQRLRVTDRLFTFKV